MFAPTINVQRPQQTSSFFGPSLNTNNNTQPKLSLFDTSTAQATQPQQQQLGTVSSLWRFRVLTKAYIHRSRLVAFWDNRNLNSKVKVSLQD